MNLKTLLAVALLLIVASVPAMADGKVAAEIAEDDSLHSEITLSAQNPEGEELMRATSPDEPSLQLTEFSFIESGTTTRLTCEEIDGTPCTTSESCGSCYPTPRCPLTPCFCSYGACLCDI